MAIPLLAGNLQEKDIPGPFRGAAGGKLNVPTTLDRLIYQLEKALRWPQRKDLSASQKRYDLVKYATDKTFARDPIEEESKASFTAKRSRIGSTQGQVIDYVTTQIGLRPHIPGDELEKKFAKLGTSFHYRLEQLRLLGFLDRTRIGESQGVPVYGWGLSEKYRSELGL